MMESSNLKNRRNVSEECFAALKPLLQPYVDDLKRRVPITRPTDLPKEPGLYLLSRNGEDLYIGITGNLRGRWALHRGKDPMGASFAVKLAREALGLPATYKKGSGLKSLLLDRQSRLQEAFDQARADICKMGMRFIEWKAPKDDVGLAMLEMYAAHALVRDPIQRFRYTLSPRLRRRFRAVDPAAHAAGSQPPVTGPRLAGQLRGCGSCCRSPSRAGSWSRNRRRR
jgi:hypothetical protein